MAWPVSELAELRTDVERSLADTLDLAGDLGERIRAKAMRRYARIRDAQTKPTFDFTVRLASSEPPGPERLLFAAIAERPEWVTQFFGTFTGSVPMTEFFSPRKLIGLVGVLGFAKLARAQAGTLQPRPADQTRAAASAAQ